MSMLTEICQELRNWFDRDQAKYFGSFKIENGEISSDDWTLDIIDGQCFRIIGSALNDGVYRKGIDSSLS